MKGNIVFVANNIITTSGVPTNEVPPSGNAINNDGLGAYVDIDDQVFPIFDFGSAWRWYSTGALPAANWNATTFNDAFWRTDNGEFGYGDNDETTCLPYGCNSNICNPTTTCGKYITYYFRKSFNIASLAALDKIRLSFKRDDGIVVYVNGIELLRDNMPNGTITNTTLASSNISGADENVLITNDVPAALPFVDGNNVIAVEIHQDAARSSDLSFDMAISGLASNGTFSSSSADLVLPSTCTRVLFAGLYWGATLGGTNDATWRVPAYEEVLLRMPGAATYTNIRSTQTDIHDYGIPDINQNHVGYVAFADITNIINVDSANGTYTLANMIGPTGYANCAGGWAIVIAFEDISDPVPKNLVVFDGASFVTSSNFIDIPLSGFQTPVVGPVVADFGVVCYDGDRNNEDGFYFKQDSVGTGTFIDMSLPTNAISLSGVGDSWNSTIANFNNLVNSRNPAHANTLGFDANLIRLNNINNTLLGNSRSTARLRLNSGGEKYYLQVVTSSISVAVPSFTGTLVSTDVNGGATIAPNDIIQYDVNYINRGTDTAILTTVFDTIPYNTIYERNSLQINGIAKTDAIGDDEAEYDPIANRVVFRVGLGANRLQGGIVYPFPQPNNDGAVSFRVKAIDICEILKCNATISNRSFIGYRGKLTGFVLKDIIASPNAGCDAIVPIRDTIIGQCATLRDTLLTNVCPQTTITIPAQRYPNYIFYNNINFVPANIINPTIPIARNGVYYATIVTPFGCLDTVRIRAFVLKCNDIDDDDDGIPDYVEALTFGAMLDHDNDGEPNWSDPQFPGRIDNDGDQFDDRFDAAADADNDGIPNFYDRDFAFVLPYQDLNGDGINDRYDSDLDGVINQFDLDSDNDGIPDVAEQGGVDTNGDGIIDNYLDTDGDGFSQNLDANNSGARGSGNGLTYFSFETDGVPNAMDLDSDNDGIPDLVEVYANDVNNDAMVDGVFNDNDVDGFTDLVDGDRDFLPGAENMANALMLTGPDIALVDGRADSYPNKNFDYDLLPNLFDVDSDADGLLDVTEAALPKTVDGFVNGNYGPKGWSDLVAILPALTLPNFDNTGRPDVLDIDSDDDGIPDLIEGQPTAYPLPTAFALPQNIDTDRDGMDNSFDNYPAAFSATGVTPVDTDFDGQPDYLDLDSDADLQPDVIEGNDFNRNGFFDDDVIPTGWDTDGDGLDNKFDSSNVSTKGTSYNVGNGAYNNGDVSPGSRTPVQRTNPLAIDRDWRSIGFILASTKAHLQLIATTTTGYLFRAQALAASKIVKLVIEQSKDGRQYVAIDQIISSPGNSMSFETQFKTPLFTATYFYRIVVMVENGNPLFSNIIRIVGASKENEEISFTNPNSGNFLLTIYSQSVTLATVELVDFMGRVVYSTTQILSHGKNTLSIEARNKCAAGLYILRIRTRRSTNDYKLMIQY